MKKFLCSIIMLGALPVAAYQTGSVSRPQFKTTPVAGEAQADEKAKPSVPGQQGVQTRSFTSYGSRPGNAWRQGVQTKTVQTQTAGRAAAPKEAGEETIVGGADKLTQQGKIAKTAKSANTAKEQPATPAAAPKATPQAAQKPADAAAQPAQDPAAMMQQLQAMQGMMGALGGGASGGAQGGKGGTPAAGGAMPAGMPDLSALMNMAGQGNTKK